MTRRPRARSRPNPGRTPAALAIISLTALALQNTTLALVLHASRTATPHKYYPPSAVFLTETAKAAISAGLAIRALRRRGSAAGSSIARLRSLALSRSALPLTLPAVLYVVQNNLQYTAAGNLEPAVFQTLYQLKILTTALCARVLLGTLLSHRQWAALSILAIGVAIVQVGDIRAHGGPGGAGPPPPPPPAPEFDPSLTPPALVPPPPPPPTEASPLLGFLAVLCACFTSGLAGVWFEKVLKKDPAAAAQRPASPLPVQETVRPGEVLFADDEHAHARKADLDEEEGRSTSGETSRLRKPSHEHHPVQAELHSTEADDGNLDLWVRNLQLSLFSLIPALVPVLAACFSRPGADTGLQFDLAGPWHNFGAWAWAIVALQTIGGLVTACVMRWADNILKCFAVALALLLTSLLSIPLFDFHLTPSFVLGAGLTLAATALYQTRSGGAAAAVVRKAGAPANEDEGVYPAPEATHRNDDLATRGSHIATYPPRAHDDIFSVEDGDHEDDEGDDDNGSDGHGAERLPLYHLGSAAQASKVGLLHSPNR
ncbi:unnamed protein product [Parajaminaea phylloscopi]